MRFFAIAVVLLIVVLMFLPAIMQAGKRISKYFKTLGK